MGAGGTVLWAGLMLAVAGTCLGRCLASRHDPEHPVDLDAWHVVMGVAMAAMFAWPLHGTVGLGLVVVFGSGVLCAAARARGGRHRAGYLRLGVGSVAMVVMLLPGAAAASPPVHGSHGAHGAHGGAPGAAGWAPPEWLCWVLVAGLAVASLAAVVAAARRSPTVTRTGAAGEAVMGVGMVLMLLPAC